jgi:hypothetical protein
MEPRYTSFLLRCWRLGDGRRRIELEHIQSGARARVASLEAACAWIETCQANPAATLGPPAADTPNPAAREEKTP